jgi:hypothetical protein
MATVHKTIADKMKDEILKADGFDDCIIGQDHRTGRLIYSVDKIIEQLVSEGLSYEDAVEHFGFNIGCAYVGEDTPIFMEDYNEE